jgi:aminopeptidase N
MDNAFINRHSVQVMWRDAFQRVQPLKFDIRNNDDIQLVFSDILVSKSAALIRMIESSVGKDNFKEDVIVNPRMEIQELFKFTN